MGNNSNKLIFLCYKQDNKCYYCNKTMSYDGAKKDNPSIDHIVPTVNGGVNKIDNMVASCILCNTSKGDKTIDEFYDYLGIEIPHDVKRGRSANEKRSKLYKRLHRENIAFQRKEHRKRYG